MNGTAYGAENDREGPAMIDVRQDDGTKVRISCEPSYGEDIARAIVDTRSPRTRRETTSNCRGERSERPGTDDSAGTRATVEITPAASISCAIR